MTPPRTAEATFVKWVDDPSDLELLNMAKALTYFAPAEHAVLELEDGQYGLFRGGLYGIDLLLDADGDAVVRVGRRWRRLRRVVWHVRPLVTGPSDADRSVLRLLCQDQSHLWEINGDPAGQSFGPFKPEP